MKLCITNLNLKQPPVNKSSTDAVKKFRNDISTLFKADNLTAESKFLKIVNFFNDLNAASKQSSLSTLRLMLKKGFEAHQWKVNLDQLDTLSEKIKCFERQNSSKWLRCNKSATCQLTYPEGKFQCTTCGESFEISVMLGVHMKDVHKVQAILKDPNLKCIGKCKKDFGDDAKAYINHLKQKHVCQGKHIPCPVGCRSLFPGASMLDIENHVARTHACTVCNEITIDLKLHYTNFHQGETLRSEIETEEPEKEADKLLPNCLVPPLKRPMSERIGPLKNAKIPKLRKKSEITGVTKKLAFALSKKACSNARKAYKKKSNRILKSKKLQQSSKQPAKDCVICSFCNFEIPIRGFSCPYPDCYCKFDYRFEVLDHVKGFHGQNIETKSKCEKCQIELSFTDLKIHMMNEHQCLSAHLRCPLECVELFESELEIVDHLESKHGMFGNRPKHKSVRFADAALFRDMPAVTRSNKKLNMDQRLGPLGNETAVKDNGSTKSNEKLNLSNKEKVAKSVLSNQREIVKQKESCQVVKTTCHKLPNAPFESSPKLRKRTFDQVSPLQSSKRRLDFNQNIISDCSSSPNKLQLNDSLSRTAVDKSQVESLLNEIMDKSVSLGKIGFDIYRYRLTHRQCLDVIHNTGSLRCWTCKLQYPKAGFSCNHCDENFVTAGNLMLHKGLNYGEFQDQMQCSCCRKVFTSVRELLNHEIQNACSKHYECPFQCDYLYTSKDALINHIMAKHLDSFCEEIKMRQDANGSPEVLKVNQSNEVAFIDLTTECSSQECCEEKSKPCPVPTTSIDGNLSDSSDIIDVTPSTIAKEAEPSTTVEMTSKSNIKKLAKSQLKSVKQHCVAKFSKSQQKLVKKQPMKVKKNQKVEKNQVTFYGALSYLIVLHPKNGRFTSGCNSCERVKPSARYYRCRLCPKRTNRDLFSNFSLYIEAVVHLEIAHKLKITGDDLKCDSAMCRLGGSKKSRATMKFKTVKEFYNHIIVRHSLCKRHYLCPFHCGQIFNNSGSVFGHLKNCRYNPKK